MKNKINNISDINSLLQDKEFNNLLKKVNNRTLVTVKNNLIHNNNLTHKEQLLHNIDMYINFLKSKLFIDQFQLRYIVHLTIYNKYNKILLSNIYYYEDIDNYIKEYIKMFMYKYNKNYKFLSKYINIKKRNFDELIELINKRKKRTYIYFEDININNMNFYITLINELESNS